MEPTVRQPVYEAYWRFAAERQAIFHRRVRGEPGPWTTDEILAGYKFCNTYRASDRVSQYLIREVIYGPSAAGLSDEDILLRIVLFRLFSKERTWEIMERATGGIRRATLDVDHLGDVLREARMLEPIYTAAFILSAQAPYGHAAKHRNHLALVQEMFQSGGLGKNLANARSLKDVYETLISWPMIGPFLAYQIAVDLNYSTAIDFSENDFTMPGPGAVRGLRKVFVEVGDRTPHALIMDMVDRQEDAFATLGIEFKDLFGRPLHAIDCQGLFCEVDKYSRVRFPELKSERLRIKQSFTPTSAALPLFYPPKWGINGAAAVAQSAADRGERQEPAARLLWRQPAQLALYDDLPWGEDVAISGPPNRPRDHGRRLA